MFFARRWKQPMVFFFFNVFSFVKRNNKRNLDDEGKKNWNCYTTVRTNPTKLNARPACWNLCTLCVHTWTDFYGKLFDYKQIKRKINKQTCVYRLIWIAVFLTFYYCFMRFIFFASDFNMKCAPFIVTCFFFAAVVLASVFVFTTWQWKLSTRQMQLHACAHTKFIGVCLKLQMWPSLNCWAYKWFDQMLLKPCRYLINVMWTNERDNTYNISFLFVFFFFHQSHRRKCSK